jgi:flagellar basal body-associated protein FliL
MIKLVLIGVWACVITLASSYAATYWKANQQKAAAAEQSSHSVEYRKTKELTIPKISDGGIQGYVVVQFSYSVDSELEKTITAPPEAFLCDEAFRYIYSDDTIDFSNLKKYDLQKMTKTLTQNVNARLNGNLVRDILIQEFNYMTRADVKKQM